MTAQYLALGDSYTIGEGVALFESFPYQLTQALRRLGVDVSAPEIIAKTGWSVAELNKQLHSTTLLSNYSLVTLLIGVNDQYRGYPVESFAHHFDLLFQDVIQLVKDPKRQLVLFSIPDWGLSPFAAGRNKEEISTAIDEYNKILLRYCQRFELSFIDISSGMRRMIHPELAFAEDGLHPAESEYRRWVELAVPVIMKLLGHA